MARKALEFTVHGRPAQMGSKRAFVRNGRAVMVNDNSDRLRQWYTAVASTAAEAVSGAAVLTGPIRLTVTFSFKRPKSHFGSGTRSHILKPTAPLFHVQKPDLDKLVRCTKDALSSVVWRDDSQVCQCIAEKGWSSNGVEGADLRIEEME